MSRLCEWWLMSRRQCRRVATVEVDQGYGPPRWFCKQHSRKAALMQSVTADRRQPATARPRTAAWMVRHCSALLQGTGYVVVPEQAEGLDATLPALPDDFRTYGHTPFEPHAAPAWAATVLDAEEPGAGEV